MDRCIEKAHDRGTRGRICSEDEYDEEYETTRQLGRVGTSWSSGSDPAFRS